MSEELLFKFVKNKYVLHFMGFATNIFKWINKKRVKLRIFCGLFCEENLFLVMYNAANTCTFIATKLVKYDNQKCSISLKPVKCMQKSVLLIKSLQ